MRLAAGVALALAITVAGGPSAAVAVADPGSGSPSNHFRDGEHSRGDRHDPRGPRHQRGPRGGDHPGDDRPGGSRGELATPARDIPSLVVAPAAPTPTASRGVVSAAPPAPQLVAPVSPPPARTGRGGVSHARPAASPLAPRVVVGNGRPPAPVRVRADVGDPPARPRPVVTVAPPVAPIVAPVAAPAPVTVQAAPAPRFELPASSPWATVRPGWPTGTIFGMAGLLLAPIAGLWLGHRQARATKSASQLVSR
jgi:hypothetical protein